jgi:hypothetical protein
MSTFEPRRHIFSVRIVGGAIATCFLFAAVTHAQEKPKPKREPVLVLIMKFDGTRHDIQSARIIEASLPVSTKGKRVEDGLSYVVTDAQGTAVLTSQIKDPTVIHGPGALPNENGVGHPVVTANDSIYVLRVPYQKKMRYLKISGHRTTAARQAKPGAQSATAVDESLLDINVHLATESAR